MPGNHQLSTMGGEHHAMCFALRRLPRRSAGWSRSSREGAATNAPTSTGTYPAQICAMCNANRNDEDKDGNATILTCGTYQKGRVSLRAQGTKWQVIFHCAYACPKLNHVMLWNMVAGSLTSLSIFNDLSCLQNSLPTWLSPSLALRQCCQFAVVHSMLKKMTGSFNYSSCSMISDNKYKIRAETIQQ